MSIRPYSTKRAKAESSLPVRPMACAVLVAALLFSIIFTVSAQNAAPSELTITVSSQGLTPGTATVNSGLVHLTIDNQKALERVTLRVTNQSGELVREISVPDKASLWKTEVELATGQYVISDISNSSSSCRITVQTAPTR